MNGTTNAGPHQLKRAEIAPATSTRGGELTASYDLAGNMVRMDVDRNGPCLATTTGATPGCALVFKYEWDEKNRLTRARRWDRPDVNADLPPNVANNTETMDLRYRYDADDNRVIKSAKQLSTSAERHTLYVFDTLELRRAAYGTPTANEYDLNMNTEVPYLFANGVRLGRVVYEPTTPLSSPSAQHVFLELGDHLGSTSTVLDKATGELVEKSTYQAYGAAESDFRPEQWKEFREDYRFTGKEEDVEVGLVYFGKRFYSAQLNRWMSPDPLGIHSPLETDLNLYAYVRGMSLKAVDPAGLRDTPASLFQAAASAYQARLANAGVRSEVTARLLARSRVEGYVEVRRSAEGTHIGRRSPGGGRVVQHTFGFKEQVLRDAGRGDVDALGTLAHEFGHALLDEAYGRMDSRHWRYAKHMALTIRMTTGQAPAERERARVVHEVAAHYYQETMENVLSSVEVIRAERARLSNDAGFYAQQKQVYDLTRLGTRANATGYDSSGTRVATGQAMPEWLANDVDSLVNATTGLKGANGGLPSFDDLVRHVDDTAKSQGHDAPSN